MIKKSYLAFENDKKNFKTVNLPVSFERRMSGNEEFSCDGFIRIRLDY